jgi:tetratricopeptide (TPR) repeat protein
MTIGLVLSKDGNDFLWEEEAKILVETKQNEEAISLMKVLLNESKDNIFSSLYITDFYIKIIESKQTISIVKDELDVLSKLEMEPEQKGDLLYQQLLCLNKMGDAKKSIEFKKSVLEYYQQNDLDSSILDNL